MFIEPFKLELMEVTSVPLLDYGDGKYILSLIHSSISLSCGTTSSTSAREVEKSPGRLSPTRRANTKILKALWPILGG